MANKDLQRKPHNISEDAWWYEDTTGIDVLVAPSDRIQTVHISWRSIRAALERKDRPRG